MIGARDYQSRAGSGGFVIQTSECGPSKEGSGPVGRCLGFGLPSLGGPFWGLPMMRAVAHWDPLWGPAYGNYHIRMSLKSAHIPCQEASRIGTMAESPEQKNVWSQYPIGKEQSLHPKAEDLNVLRPGSGQHVLMGPLKWSSLLLAAPLNHETRFTRFKAA